MECDWPAHANRRTCNVNVARKLLYDGACPFCRREVDWLKRRDRYGTLATEDISDPAFDASRYGLTKEVAMRSLHAVLPDGRMVCGMEAVRQAYQAVGLGWIVVPTRLPVVSSICDRFYSAFPTKSSPLGTAGHGSCRPAQRWLCMRRDRSAAGLGNAAIAGKSEASGWVQDADRQPFLPHKQTIQRRGMRPSTIPGLHKFARR